MGYRERSLPIPRRRSRGYSISLPINSQEHAVTIPTRLPTQQSSLRDLPRNVWAVSLTSFFMDISSEMVINLLPLFLTSVLGVRTSVVGLIEGLAEAIASLLKLFSGWLSDRLRG